MLEFWSILAAWRKSVRRSTDHNGRRIEEISREKGFERVKQFSWDDTAQKVWKVLSENSRGDQPVKSLEPKIAFVHDWLVTFGGGEQVLPGRCWRSGPRRQSTPWCTTRMAPAASLTHGREIHTPHSSSACRGRSATTAATCR